jgi:hypothetical protein
LSSVTPSNADVELAASDVLELTDFGGSLGAGFSRGLDWEEGTDFGGGQVRRRAVERWDEGWLR